MTRSDPRADEAAVDPDLQPLLDAFAVAFPTPPHLVDPQEYRERSAALAKRRPLPADIVAEDRIVSHDGRQVSIRIYRPSGPTLQPALLYIHGGGWISSSVDLHDDTCTAIALATPCTVVSVEYALAPEHPYPAALLDCKAAADWLFQNSTAAGVDASCIAVGGGSSGGNLSAALCLKYRDLHGSAPFCGQYLLYPVLDVDLDTTSYQRYANGPLLTRELMAYFWRHYLQRPLEEAEIYAAPGRARDLSNLPRAYIVAAEFDPLKDDATHYAMRLIEAGVDVEYRLARHLVHGFLGHRSISSHAARELTAMCRHLAGTFMNRGVQVIAARS